MWGVPINVPITHLCIQISTVLLISALFVLFFHRIPNAVGVAMTLNPNGVGVKAEPVMSTGVGGVGGPRKQSATKT